MQSPKSSRRAADVILVGESPRELLSLSESSQALESFGVSHAEILIGSEATPGELRAAQAARVAIVAVGTDPGLALDLARQTALAVIAVPLTEKALERIVSRARSGGGGDGGKGCPLAIVAIGGAFNGGLLAAQFLAGDERAARALRSYKEGLRRKVLEKRLPKA